MNEMERKRDNWGKFIMHYMLLDDDNQLGHMPKSICHANKLKDAVCNVCGIEMTQVTNNVQRCSVCKKNAYQKYQAEFREKRKAEKKETI